METKGVNVQLSIKEIYACVCPDCKLKIRDMIKGKVADSMVTEIISGKGE